MTTREQLEQEVIANPHDMSACLVMADWLEEQGDIRGQFIRAQCQIAKLTDEDPEFDELDKLQWKLIKSHKEEWIAPLKPYCQARLFRGFAEDVRFGALQYITAAQRVFELAPVCHTRIHQISTERFDEILAHPTLKFWTEVSLGTQNVLTSQFEQLANHNLLGNLTKLRCSWCPDAAGISEILNGRIAQHLTALTLEEADDANEVTAESQELVCGSETLTKLECLYIGRARLHTLMQNQSFEKLESLHCCLDDDFYVADQDFPWPAANLPNLVSLTLESKSLSKSLIEAIFLHSQLGSLRRVRLTYLMDSDILDAIAQSQILPQLSTLDLGGSSFSDEVMCRLLGANDVSRMRVLRLGNCQLSDPTAQFILESEDLSQLRKLDLSGNDINGEIQKQLRKKLGQGVCTFSRPK